MVPRLPGPAGGELTRILVSGAGGYIGSRLALGLATAPGTTVRGLVRHNRDWLAGVEQVEIDLMQSPDRLPAAMQDVDAVVHLAGPNEALAAEDPEGALVGTVLPAWRVAAAAADAGVRRIVFVSTVHVYGAALVPGAEITEAVAALPRDAYAIARLASEHLIASAAGDRLAVVVLRLTNSVGAPAHPAVQRWTLVVNDLCRQAVLDGSVELRTHGMQWRDFVPLADVCDLATSAVSSDRLPPGTYNLSSGVPMTIRDVAGLVQDSVERHTGQRVPLRAPKPPADPPVGYVVQSSRLASAGLAPQGTVADAVDETVQFCLRWKEQLQHG